MSTAAPSTIAASTTWPAAGRARLEDRADDAEGQEHPAAAEVADEVEREQRPLALAPDRAERARDRDVVDVVPGDAWPSGRPGRSRSSARRRAADCARERRRGRARAAPSRRAGSPRAARRRTRTGASTSSRPPACLRSTATDRAAAVHEVPVTLAERGASAAQPVDPDHVGAEVGEQHGRERAGADARDLDDPDALQRAAHARSATRPRSKPSGSSRSWAASRSVSREDLGARAVGDDPAGGQDHRALAERRRERQVVGDDEHRALDLVEQLDQLAARARVEVRRRLVEHEQARAASRARSRSRRAGAGRARAGAARGRRAPACARRVSASAIRSSTSSREQPRLSGPNATSSRTVGMNSWSSGSWKTSPTRARRSRTSSWPTRRPATSSSPSPVSSALRWSISVVLPAPLGPRTATRSPWVTCRSTPSRPTTPFG